MAKIGEYQWRQISMWDLLPDNCIAKNIHSGDGKHVFNYYLQIVVEVYDGGGYRVETVTDPSIVPKDILGWRVPDYLVRFDRHVTAQAERSKE